MQKINRKTKEIGKKRKTRKSKTFSKDTGMTFDVQRRDRKKKRRGQMGRKGRKREKYVGVKKYMHFKNQPARLVRRYLLCCHPWSESLDVVHALIV